MLVGELIDTLDSSLVLELYGLRDSKKPSHEGTFYLDDDGSKSELLHSYGHVAVKHKDLYKAYVLVYIDG